MFADASYARLPLRQETAEAMLEELQAAPVLDSYAPRGSEGRARLVEAIETLAAAFLHLDALDSLTLNPVRVHAKGIDIGGGKATVGPSRGTSPDLTTLEP